MFEDAKWNNVTIYGPQADIDRFRDMCIVPPSPDDADGKPDITFDHVIASAKAHAAASAAAADHRLAIDIVANAGSDPWNLRVTAHEQPGVYDFAFDTIARFPIPVFQHLARLFPALLFECDCIPDDDSSMGFGWFNTPPGGEDFRDDYPVPENYWTDQPRARREPDADSRHQTLVAELKRWLLEAG